MRAAGAASRENVGMSNDNPGEKPGRRKTEVSGDDANQNRVSRDLRARRRPTPDGERVNIPVPTRSECEGGRSSVRPAR